jgi:ABC-type branched-subunit amino acid transport system ATPase component
MSGDSPLLSIQEMTVRHAGITAVKSVSLDLYACEVAGLIGPNGAGKTSLIDGISGYANAHGRVLLEGRNIAHMRAHKRARLGLVRTFQGVELYEGLTVAQNMTVASLNGSLRGLGRDLLRLRDPVLPDIVSTLLDELELEPVRDVVASELPLGQQKLVTVGRAIAMRPKILLLDEPAAGLDSTESREFGGMLARLSRYASTVLLIEHDINLVLRICDRVHVLESGQLIASGRPEEIRDDPTVITAYLGSTYVESVSD